MTIDLKIKADLHTPVHCNTVLYTIAKRWKQTSWFVSSTDEEMNKVWSVHTLECYSVIRRSEVLMDLANMMLSQTSRHKRTHTV